MVTLKYQAIKEDDDDIVITGISGRFPESDNVEELAKHLYEGNDVITEDGRRWPPGLYGLPKGGGKLKSLSKFDAEFFGISGKQVQNMDPQSRILLEVTYEALVDAGYNVNEFHQSNTGVFVAISATDAKDFINRNETKANGYDMMGCLPAFFANRISQSLDFRGPSYSIDNGCASSMTALVHAMSVLRSGQCDAAIVASANLCLLPQTNISMNKLHALSPDSCCKTFTADADGYVRSETVVAVLIQRRSAARRVYATIRGGRTNIDGYKPQGFTYPSKDMQSRLAADTYKEAGLSPKDVAYIEAHGTATKAGDYEELSGIVELFCKARKTPLLIGSLKTNIGHTEPASGLCSVVKVLLAMERGVIPGNLHYHSANPEIPALTDGRLKVVDKNMPWDGGIASVNSFGFGGSNAHVILESQSESSSSKTKYYSIPILVVASGRTKKAVQEFLTLAQAHSDNSELHALLDAVHAKNVSGHQHRGYALLGDQFVEEFSVLDNIRRPIWFVFTGSFRQTESVQSLLKLSVFKASIERSAIILRPNGVDLNKILTEVNNTEDTFCSTVALVAIHLALVDLLHDLKIKSDGNIGHSIGRIGCNYASGALTAEQAINYAYWYSCNHTKDENCKYVKQKFEKLGSTFHTQGGGDCNGRLSDADNFLKNMHAEDPVFKISEEVPENAILVNFGSEEVSHTVVNNNAYDNLPLLKNEAEDLCQHLLTSIGKLYNAGAQPQISHLYPSVKWPVSRGTPGLSSHVIWNHSTNWNVPHYKDYARINDKTIDFDLKLPENAFLSGYHVDGNVMIPVSAYLFHVWRTYANIKNVNIEDTTVVFENVEFKKSVEIQNTGNIQLEVSVLPRTGSFEICNNDNEVIATGVISFITEYNHDEDIIYGPKEIANDEILLLLTAEDIYKELKLRGYDYDGLFRGILTADLLFTSGTVSWNNNWITFIETMLQFDIIGRQTRDLYMPSQIEKIVINPKAFLQSIADSKNVVKIFKHQDKSSVETVGVLLDNLKWSKRRSNPKAPKLENCIFYPYTARQASHSDVTITKQDILTAIVQIVLENVNMLKVKVCEIASDETILMPDLIDILDVEPVVRMEGTLYTGPQYQANHDFTDKNIKMTQTDAQFDILEVGCHLIVVSSIMSQPGATEILRNLKLSLAKYGMILLKELNKTFEKLQHIVEESGLFVVFHQVHEDFAYILLGSRKTVPKEHQIIEISSCDDDYQWVDTIRDAVKSHKTGDSRIYLVSYDYDSGLLGMCNCLRKEVGGSKIRVYFLPGISENFTVNKDLYSSQVEKDVAVNVLRNGVWGTYRHLQLEDKITSGLRLNFQADKSYILVGGLGGVGLELSNWLVSRGVTKLVFISRSGIKTGYQSWCVRRWQNQGVKVLISNEDVSTIDGAVSLLEEASALGSIGGIFNLAVVLEDATLANQSSDSFKSAGKPKINITRSLDIASRELAPDLEYFVVFSSLSCGRGNYGQTNYGYANSAMERIIEQRHEDGLPGLAIQWGPIDDVGIMANTPDDEHLQLGTLKQKMSSCLETLKTLLAQPYAVVGCCVVADKRKQSQRFVKRSICQQIADIFCITDANSVSQSATLRSLGMDSIMAIEIHRALEVDHGVHFAMDQINSLSFSELKKLDEALAKKK